MTKTAKTQISKLKEPKSEKPRVKRQKDHDIFVRGILSINTLVLKLLLHYVPKDVQPFLDFSTLKDITDMQVSNKLRLTQSDSIHECMLNVSKLPESVQQMDDLPTFRFCFLWEHKSSKPQNPIEFQVESYRYGIIYADLKKELPPSIVIPILIYHGQEAWDKKRLFERVEAYLPPELLAYIPYPKYIIIDLQAMSEADIEALSDLEEIRAAFIALKYAHDKDFFKQNMKKVLKFTRDLTATYMFREFFKMLLEYMQRRAQIEKEEFDDIVDQNLDDEMATKKVFKTTFEVGEERAELRGLRKGILALIAETSLTNSQIAKMLDVEEAFVKAIRQEIMASQQQA